MNRRTAMIVGASALAVLVLWFLLLWQPKGNELSKAQERQEAAETQVNELESRLARLQSVQEQAPALLAKQDKLRSAIPEDASLAQFILDANDAAIDAGVDFISISPAKPTASTTGVGPSEVGLTINVTGGYFQVLDFVNQLDGLSRVVVIDTFSVVTGESTSGGPPVLTVGITGRMFTTAPVVDPAAATTPTTTPTSETSTSAPPTTNVTVTR